MGQSTSDAVNTVAPGLGSLGSSLTGGGSKGPQLPQQPDYVGAANAQSAGTINASLANNYMSQPDVNTPFGSQTWSQTGSNTINIPGYGNISIPHMQQNVTLSPEQQALYEQQTGLKGNLLGQAGQNLSQPFSSNAQGIADQAYGQMTARLDPQWAHNEEMQKSQLANQGLAAGGEAYDNAMRDFNNAKNDAYSQANLQSLQLMPQTYQIDQGIRDLPLNELSSLSNSNAVSTPQFQPTQYSQGAQGPNLLGATGQQSGYNQSLYNSQVQQQNAMLQGLMGLGGAGMLAFA